MGLIKCHLQLDTSAVKARPRLMSAPP